VSAPTFALITGLVYTALGFAGFTSFLPQASTINALHLVIGFWGLFSWSGATSAVNFSRGVALVLGLLAILGGVAALTQPLAILPVREPHAWLHGTTALLGAYFGFRSLARRAHPAERRRHNPKDRRVAFRPVAYERRVGANDRRQAHFGGSSLAAG
jgi:hypothetical protein